MSVNKCMIIGQIGADAEIRQVGQNTVANFRVATSERWRNQDGTTSEETTWHSVSLWGQTGVHQFLKKGQQVYVEGSYKMKEWTDQQNNKRRDYYIKAYSVQLLGAKPQAQQQAPAPQYQQPAPPPAAPGYAQPPMPPQPQYSQPPVPPQPQYNPPYPPQDGGDLPF